MKTVKDLKKLMEFKNKTEKNVVSIHKKIKSKVTYENDTASLPENNFEKFSNLASVQTFEHEMTENTQYIKTFKSINNKSELLKNKTGISIKQVSNEQVNVCEDLTKYHSVSSLDPGFIQDIPKITKDSLFINTKDNGFMLVYSNIPGVINYNSLNHLGKDSNIKLITGKIIIPVNKVGYKTLVKDVNIYNKDFNGNLQNYTNRSKVLTLKERLCINKDATNNVKKNNELISDKDYETALSYNALGTHIKAQHPNIIFETDKGTYIVTLTHGKNFTFFFNDKQSATLLKLKIDTIDLYETTRCTPFTALTHIDSDFYYNNSSLFKNLGLNDKELLALFQSCNVNNYEDFINLIIGKVYVNTDICIKGAYIFDTSEVEYIDTLNSDKSVFLNYNYNKVDGFVSDYDNNEEYLSWYFGKTLNDD